MGKCNIIIDVFLHSYHPTIYLRYMKSVCDILSFVPYITLKAMLCFAYFLDNWPLRERWINSYGRQVALQWCSITIGSALNNKKTHFWWGLRWLRTGDRFSYWKSTFHTVVKTTYQRFCFCIAKINDIIGAADTPL